MDIARFEIELRSEGYERIETKQLVAGTCSTEHDHPFNVRAMILDGETSISAAGVSRTYKTGEVIDIPAGCLHAERVGASGVSFIIGMRAGAPASRSPRQSNRVVAREVSGIHPGEMRLLRPTALDRERQTAP